MFEINRLIVLLATGALLTSIVVLSSQAAPIEKKAATDFNFLWSWDQQPASDSFDLYNNTTGAPTPDGVNDWSANLTSPDISITDDVLNVYSEMPDAPRFASDLWASVPDFTQTSGYTFEYRIRVSDTEGNLGVSTRITSSGNPYSGMAYKTTPAENPEYVDVYYALHGNTSDAPVAQFTTTEFFVIRITETYDADTESTRYSLYINGQLVLDDTGPTSTPIGQNLFDIGSISSGNGGTIEIDYLGFTPGAYAPIPEPNSLALIGAVAVFITLSRRRQPLS